PGIARIRWGRRTAASGTPSSSTTASAGCTAPPSASRGNTSNPRGRRPRSARRRVDPLTPPGPARLLGHGPFHLDALIGTALFAAIAFGLVALAIALARRRPVAKLRLGLAAGMGSWLVLAVAVLSFIYHMPLRYLE